MDETDQAIRERAVQDVLDRRKATGISAEGIAKLDDHTICEVLGLSYTSWVLIVHDAITHHRIVPLIDYVD